MTTWVIRREEAETLCENPHPVRLSRKATHYFNEPWERRMAIDRRARGYRCPGGEPHGYPIWVVCDKDDINPHQEVCESRAEAERARARLIEEDERALDK